MNIFARHQKTTAFALLLVLTVELFAPTMAYALTSGPTQPETKGFEPIGNFDMVDLFSGDFSYNIPLMDVGGYPVNLSYKSGATLDDEASWVGYGWSLNVGALNRQLRGLPDDFNGQDKQVREKSMKDHITKGGNVSATLEFLGLPLLKLKNKKKKLNLVAPTISVGVKYDNYRGIGMQLGVNPGLSLTDDVADKKTWSHKDSSNTRVGSVGLNLSSFDGASTSLNYSILSSHIDNEEKTSLSKSVGFGYNTRAGLTGLTLSNSMSKSEERRSSRNFTINSSFISFNSESYTPTIEHETLNNSYTFSLHFGPELFGSMLALGASGFYSQQTIAEKRRSLPAYGYLHSEKGKDNPYALMDFNREKDIPHISSVKYLPVPVPTYDLFTATSQEGSGQYRAYRGSSGVYFDPRTETKSKDYSVGFEFGAGTYFDVGADLYYQSIKTKTQKWVNRNQFLSKGDFTSDASDPYFENAYFKRVGEPVPADRYFLNVVKNTEPISVALPKGLINPTEGAEASDRIITQHSRGSGEATAALKHGQREVRNTTFSYLTALEAAQHGLDKKIIDHHPDSLVFGGCVTEGVKNSYQRNSGYRKGHHISEVTITADDGKRTVYGIPVYNTYQEEVTFSSRPDTTQRRKGLIEYADGEDNSSQNKKGREHFYSKEITPAYATSYLLTGVLSPDYVDKTGNGITDDDLGTAVKFNYTKLATPYRWRTPYAGSTGKANYNEGFLSDTLDDKANYVYGEKEVWYLHSIESKTMVAQFVLEDRKDALGVLNSAGGADSVNKLKSLKEIRLYSKSDLREHGNDPAKTTPIKVVHFRYNYSICRGLPNSVDGGGKLTLEQVYFTFGENNKGVLHPYKFQYDTTAYNTYNYRQYDRWGNFKDAAFNPGGLNNSEFPYVLQDSITHRFVAAGQLNEIKLPSGGTIRVGYESDDYAYVQDRRASQMCFISGVESSGNNKGLIGAQSILVKLPKAVQSQTEMREAYFEGMDKIYFKAFLHLDAKGHWEFVPGYAEIDGVPERVNATTARIKLKPIDRKNPIAKAGWQFLRMNLPKYAYPGSDNLESNDSDLRTMVMALVTALKSIKEFIYGYEKRAEDQKFSNELDLAKSWVRLCAPEKKKLGGGARVKRIDLSDNWAEMTGVAGAKTATYTQLFDYTTKDEKGRIISSGVASYEPMLGSDENPFRQPIPYKQKQFLALDNYFYIEEPLCESYFPAASVGYSKVTVKSIGTGEAETANRTGTTVSEFFTSKEFPTQVRALGLEHRKPVSDAVFKLIGGVSYDMNGYAQGYVVELNDMHGKPKAVRVFNKSGKEISSVEYYYKTDNEAAEKKQVNNEVKVVRTDGQVEDGTIGIDVEVYSDMRQHTTDNLGVSAKVSGGAGAILFIPLPFWFPGIGGNFDKRSYRASSTIKIVNRFAVQYKVRKMQNGSNISTENLAWDAETGNVLLTRTQNEFDDPVYSFTYPAHWAYEGMGQAYRNLGSVFTGFSTLADGALSNVAYSDLVTPGDELVDVNSAKKYWVVQTVANGSSAKRIINEKGQLQSVTNLTVKLVRSGRRNLASAAIATVSSLKNPITNNRVDISAAIKVLEAKAISYSDEWEMPFYCEDCPEGYTKLADGKNCIKDEPMQQTPYLVCKAGQENTYSSCGSMLYDCYYNESNYIRHRISPTNEFWTGMRGVYCFVADTGKLSKGNCSPATAYNTSSTFATTSSTAELTAAQGSSNQTFRRKAHADTVTNQPASSAPLRSTTTQKTTSASTTTELTTLASSDKPGPLNRTGIWVCPEGSEAPLREWVTVRSTFQVPQGKTYYIGSGADNKIRIKIDGYTIREDRDSLDEANFQIWHIIPIYLNAGQHTLELAGWNEGGPAALGAEIYNNTATEIEGATSYSGLNVVFSTLNLIGQPTENTYRACPSGSVMTASGDSFVCRSTIPFGTFFNPYQAGVLGNWRVQAQYAYQVNRENLAVDPTKFGSTNIRKSGAYVLFSPFWSHNGLAWSKSEDQRWIAASEVTLFNSKGIEVENRDALGRYSSALFGYLESLPVAVASNSRYRETAFDGFEDYGFRLDCALPSTCAASGHFDFRHLLGNNVAISGEAAHSGKYSLALQGNLTLTRSVMEGTVPPLYTFLATGEYFKQSSEVAKGFSPIPGKKYLLSFWIKDNAPRDPSSSIQVNVNGSSLVSPLSSWPVVEGWKRVELPFVLPALSTSFELTIAPGSGGTVFLDDVRIHPFEGQMKSFAYDPSTQRLMAELDENNFATFYEYDDEGILIRVKKETDRGIMTLKETRSAYAKP